MYIFFIIERKTIDKNITIEIIFQSHSITDFAVEICSKLPVRDSNNELTRNDVICVELMIKRNAFEVCIEGIS